MRRAFQKSAFPVVVIALLAGHLYSYWSTPLIPSTDLPNHLAEAAIFRDIAIGAGTLAEYYSTRNLLITPNVAHIVFCALFEDVETGNAVFHTIAFIGFLLVILLLFKQVSASRWNALLVFPLFYNQNMTSGFVGWMMGIPILLLILYSTLKNPVNRRTTQSVLLAILFLCLYILHAQLYLFACGLFFFLSIIDQPRAWRSKLPQLAPLIPSVLVLVAWSVTAEEFNKHPSNIKFLLQYYTGDFFTSYGDRLKLFLWNDFGRIIPFPDPLAISAILVGLYIIFFFVALFTGRRSTLLSTPSGRRLAVFLGFSAACYFLLPNKIPGQIILYERFSSLVLLGCVLLTAFLLKGRTLTLLRPLMTAVAFVVLFLWMAFLDEYRTFADGFTKEFLRVPNAQNVTMAAVIPDYHFYAVPATLHYSNYHIIWNRGPATTKLIRYRFGAIRPGNKKLPMYNERIDGKTNLDALVEHYGGVDYLITYGSDAHSAAQRSGLFRLYRESGTWSLFSAVAGEQRPSVGP